MGASSAVRSIRVDGDYHGRFQDAAILIQFSADETALMNLLSHREFQRDAEKEEWWREDSATVWRQLFGGFAGFGGERWRDIELPTDVRILRWQGDDPTENTTVLWDESTERAFVLYTFG